MNRLSIRNQILILLVMTSFLSIVIIGGVSLYSGSKSLKLETIEKTSYILDAMKHDFEKNIIESENVIKTLESATLNLVDARKINDKSYLAQFITEITPIVEREAQNHTQSHTAYLYINPDLTHQVFDVYYADQDQDGIVERQENIPLSYFESGPSSTDSKSWWFGPIESGNGFWSEPYLWTLDNGQAVEFISYTKPIYINDVLLGVIGTDMTYEVIKNSLTLYNQRGFGNSFIIDGEDKLLADETFNLDWQLSEPILKQAQDNGFAEIQTKVGKRLIFLTTLSNKWKIGIEIDELKIYKNLFNYIIIVLSLMLLLQALFIFLSTKFSNYITLPLLDIVHTIEASQGTKYVLEIDEKLLAREDEVGTLAKALNNMSLKNSAHVSTIQTQSEKIMKEMALRREVENQLHLILSILEHSDNGIFVLDEDSRFIYANKTFSSITGYEIIINESTLKSCGILLEKHHMDQLNLEDTLQLDMLQTKANGDSYQIQLFMTRIIESQIYYLGLFKEVSSSET